MDDNSIQNPNKDSFGGETVVDEPMAATASERSVSVVSPVKNSTRSGFWLALTLVLIGAGAFGGYYLGQSTSDSQSVEVKSSTAQKQTKSESTPSKTQSVLSVGYPFGTDKRVTINLGVPSSLQAIERRSTNQDQGYVYAFSDKTNAEMGRWIFGNPKLSGSDSVAGDVSIIHIEDAWLGKTTAKQEFAGSMAPLLKYDLTTPTKKTESFSAIEKKTTEDASDAKKGFTIAANNGKLNVSYEAVHVRQATGTYSPVLQLSGYGVVDGQKYVMIGYLRLVDREYDAAEADTLADKFASGNIPEETQKLIDDYVDALKNTTIKSEKK